ncbi:hypothetical protein EVG20_g4532 [Dentipellis fragilis]|uniref:Uncharacterized protein n=1 Tax=Dentipellis fragilis TaxID=205917 RepID=A0A4Y9YWG9_9AGAM|nr:hypothetical protein EVG20_g4532 [Dentipellis fragilis]
MAPIPDMRGFVPGPTSRGTINILWSCVSTLFICIWTSVHPDIRFHFDMTPKNLTMQKLFLAISMLLMPEMMLVRVVTEHIEARWIARQFNSQFPAGSWTLADAYYVTMNGYVFKNEAIGHEDLLKLMQEGQIDPVTSDELSIRDRSKADSLAKLISCCQILWLVIQCLARAIEHLPMSTLELGTVGTAFMAVIAYGFQWHKPKDILRPTVLSAFYRFNILQPRNGKRGDVRVADASQSETGLLRGDEDGDGDGGEHRGHEGQVEKAKTDFLWALSPSFIPFRALYSSGSLARYARLIPPSMPSYGPGLDVHRSSSLTGGCLRDGSVDNVPSTYLMRYNVILILKLP